MSASSALITPEVLAESNAAFVRARTTGELPLPPSKKTLVLTCMDARILPEEAFGIKEGDAHVVRNAGARAPEALRSIIISQQLLGTKGVHVVGHTGCGMLTFTTPQARSLIDQAHPSLSSESKTALHDLDFLEFPNLEQNIKDDVAFLKGKDIVQGDVWGWIYDVGSGKLSQVA